MFNNVDGLKIDKHSLLYENLNEINKIIQLKTNKQFYIK